jgi:hypothetical protein
MDAVRPDSADMEIVKGPAWGHDREGSRLTLGPFFICHIGEFKMELLRIYPHPAVKILREKKIPQWAVARALNVSQGYLSLLLRGIKPTSEEIENGLQKIVRELEK